jgi:hypothetical protein
MRTSRALLARLERLECRTATAGTIKVRFGDLRRLPPDYTGERHVVVARELPSQFGQDWVEFEEVPGPDPTPPQEWKPGQHKRIDVHFVASGTSRDESHNHAPSPP